MESPNYELRLRIARWGVLLLLAAAGACAYLTRHALAVANTTIQAELGIDNEQFGYLYGAFSLGYMLFQIPGGWLLDRFGAKRVYGASIALWSVFTISQGTVSVFSTAASV